MSITTDTNSHFCIFEADANCYGVPAQRIREVASKPEYTEVPYSAPSVAGLWHEGSEFIPILRLPFNFDRQNSKPKQVLIVDGPHGNWGLLVDEVHTICQMEYSPNNDLADSDWSTATLGMSTWEEHSVRILQLESLYKLLEQSLSQEWLAPGDAN